MEKSMEITHGNKKQIIGKKTHRNQEMIHGIVER